MNPLCRKQVLVPLGLIVSSLVFAGCAGMAEPLPSLAVAPNNLTVSAKVGTSSALPVTLTNIGQAPVSVKQAVVMGTGFSTSGLATPVTLPAGTSTTFTVKFAASKVGVVSGNVEFMTDSQHRPAMLRLKGTGSSLAPEVASIVVVPAVATPAPKATVQFTVAIQGTTTNDSVTWAASIGTISTAGVFTAPPVGGIGTIIATSVADPTKSATATVAVAGAGAKPQPSGSGVTAVTVSPETASSITGGTLQFKASLTGTTSNTAVTWKALLGTITSGGSYTAPAKAGTDTVTATSIADDTKSGSASVKVTTASSTPTVTSVAVSPTTSTVTTGGSEQFNATVQGTATDTSVTWRAALGTVSSSGAYTAPAKAGTDKVTATSNADSSKSASATVTITAPAATPAPPPPQTAACGSSGCAAFAGVGGNAEGGGAESVGGRGGVVFEVTNLNDSGTGSLRACVEASGPRTCIFRISGLITQLSALKLTNPYLTIAGQTAPGGGIVQGGAGQNGQALVIQTHDVIIRYLTYDGIQTASGGANGTTCNHDTGTVGYEIDDNNNSNIIIDHTSHRWWGNKDMEVVSNGPGQNVHDITMQWNLLYEPCAAHPVVTEPDTFGGGSVLASVNQDWHHNFALNYDHRWPLLNNGSVRWVNNMGYNGLQNGSSAFNWDAWGGITADIIGNNYVDGPDTNGAAHNYLINNNPNAVGGGDAADCAPSCDSASTPSVYMLNNIGHTGNNTGFGQPIEPATNVVNDSVQKDQVWQGWEGAETPLTNLPNATWPSGWFRSTPMPTETFPIQADQVTSLDSVMLPTVGNSQHLDCNGNFVPNRDSQDARVIAQYQARGHGGPWNPGDLVSPANYTGPSSGPSIPTGTPCQESLHDGILISGRS